MKFLLFISSIVPVSTRTRSDQSQSKTAGSRSRSSKTNASNFEAQSSSTLTTGEEFNPYKGTEKRFRPEGQFIGQGIEGEIALQEDLRLNQLPQFNRKTVSDALKNLVYAKNLEVQLGLVIFIAIHEFKSSKRFCFLSWCEGKPYASNNDKLFTTVADWFVYPSVDGEPIYNSVFGKGKE